jgi:hypothetical protein
MADIDDISSKALDKEIKTVMKNAKKGGKEQGLIIVAEGIDEILARKLKILQSKQFFDLSKNLALFTPRLLGEDDLDEGGQAKIQIDERGRLPAA